jgi:pyruvate dehydrogenase E1 component alpha subunit
MSHHRSHGYYLAKGAPLDAMIAEFYGKITGSNGGLAGSQELSHDAHNFFSGTILSGMFAMATGAAFARKYNGTDAITVGVIGDGGMEEGIVFEALNLAAVFQLPVLFVCENNLYSAHTRIDVRSRSKSVSGRAGAFQVPTKTLDGNNAASLLDELTDIVAGIRAGKGPFCVEVETYRICGHVGPEDDDVLAYRTPQELASWKQRDPLAALRADMFAAGQDASELAAIQSAIDRRVRDAIAAAKKAAFPSFEKALRTNYSNEFSPLVTQLTRGAAGFTGGQNETRLQPY